MNKNCLIASFLLSAVCLVTMADAAENLAPADVVDATTINNDLEKFSRLLDSDRFSERRLASQELSAAGVEAFPLLEKAALNGSKEASARAMAIIQQQFVAGDEATRREAEDYLKRIAESGNEFAARRAEETLSPEEPVEQGFNPVLGGIQQRQQQQQQAIARAAQLRQLRIQLAQQQKNVGPRINVRIANGEKVIEVVDNGKEMTITQKKESIEVNVTEKKDGKDQTKTYTAKNADELKKKHPEAYGIYKKYNRGPGIQLNAFQGKIQIQGIQIQQN